MSVKFKELSDPRLLADNDPNEPKLDSEDADNVLRDKLKLRI
jgi:hypothetical protein